MKSSKKRSPSGAIAYSIGNKLVESATKAEDKQLPIKTPESTEPVEAKISQTIVSSKISPKRFSARFVLFTGTIIALLMTVGIIGGILVNERVEAETADKRIASVRFDNFVTESVETYLASPTKNKNIQANINRIINQKVTITAGPSVTAPSPATVTTWLSLNINETLNKAAVVVNQAAVKNYLNNLITSRTQSASAQVTVTHPDGSTETLFPGVDAQKVSGGPQADSRIDQNLLKGVGMKINLPTVTAPYTTTSTIPVPKLIEVDLTKKIMYVYQDSTIIKTFPVSAGKPSTPTPIGTFHIYEKLESQNMSGYNADGTKYYQPNVPWVNYFDGSDAIHGNYWRPLSWFGNINSSHGCVGVDVSNGQWIYNWAPIGTTVITHL